jgi:hypothetical protein
MDETGAPASVAEQLIGAIAAGDAARIVSLMSIHAQGQLVALARRRGFEVVTAEDAARRIWSGPWTSLFAEVQVESVAIEGQRATVTYRHRTYGRDPDDQLVLTQVDGAWLLDIPFPDDGEETQ